MTWRLLTEFFASLGYGLLSSFVPIFNSEVYIVAAQTLGPTAKVTVALGVAVGQTIGKTAIVLALRHGTRLPFLAKHVDRLKARASKAEGGKPPGRIRFAFRQWSAKLLRVLGHSRWGAAIVYLSAATGLPPLFAVQFIIPATKMSVWLFSAAVLLGRCTLFLAVAFGASAVIDRLWR
ncbi:MAG: hypothetical protein L0H41_10825 [Microlunatus sp.]|nr:hypothetical protein [Microlunatus sp.]MDN5771595.1 hypothetical protein [Microlunatus sp.]